MITGVTKGYKYKMRYVYAQFVIPRAKSMKSRVTDPERILTANALQFPD